MRDFEYMRVAAAVPVIKVANPMFNVNEIVSMVKTAYENKKALHNGLYLRRFV